MPYHVYTRTGAGALGVMTASDALAKAAECLEDGHPEVIFRDLLGNILDRSALAALAESEEEGT
jgi:hypothetical protein